MSKPKFFIVNGQLMTDRPEVFAKNFHVPTMAPVDGLTRVSPRLSEWLAEPRQDRDIDRMTAAVEKWLSEP